MLIASSACQMRTATYIGSSWSRIPAGLGSNSKVAPSSVEALYRCGGIERPWVTGDLELPKDTPIEAIGQGLEIDIDTKLLRVLPQARS